MGSVNKVFLVGWVKETPTLRVTKTGDSIANLDMSTKEVRFKDGEKVESTTWHRVQCWGKMGELVSNYTQKGTMIYVSGPLNYNSWKDESGQWKNRTDIKAYEIQLLSKPTEGYEESEKPAGPSKTISIEEDDLPF